MKCPACGSISPEEAIKCYCGYNFTTYSKALYRSFTHMRAREFFFNTWRTFAVAWRTFLLLGVIYIGVQQGISLGVGEQPSTLSEVIVLIALLIAQVITFMALTMAAHKTSDREDIGVFDSYALSFGLFGRYIWTFLLYFLIVLGGLILFIIPGIIWGCRYVFAPFAVIIEGIGGKEALSRSKDLTKHRLWAIGWREFVFGILFFLIIGIPIFLLILLVGVVTEFSEPYLEWLEVLESFGNIIGEGLLVIFNVILFKSLREELPSKEIMLEEMAEKLKIRGKILKELKDPCPYCKFNLKSGKDTCDECGKVFYEAAEEM